MSKYVALFRLAVLALLLSACSHRASVEVRSSTPLSTDALYPAVLPALSAYLDREDQTVQTQASLKEQLALEKELYLPFEKATFTDPAIEHSLTGYLLALKEGEEALAVYGQTDFAEKWTAYQDRVRQFYRTLDWELDLSLSASYQFRLDYLLATDDQRDVMDSFQQDLNTLFASLDYRPVDTEGQHGYRSYQAQAANSLDIPIQGLLLAIHLHDAQGQLVDTVYEEVSYWHPGRSISIDWQTAKDFATVEVEVGDVVAQWPWRRADHPLTLAYQQGIQERVKQDLQSSFGFLSYQPAATENQHGYRSYQTQVANTYGLPVQDVRLALDLYTAQGQLVDTVYEDIKDWDPDQSISIDWQTLKDFDTVRVKVEDITIQWPPLQ